MNHEENPHSNLPSPEILTLSGCTPEPLMGYLKALGVFRLVSEQAEPNCRAAWRNGKLVLQTKLSEEELIEFLTEKYEPSPMFSPWNGDGGFLSASGSSYSTIESIRSSDDKRLGSLQHSITMIEKMSILSEFGQNRAEAKELKKSLDKRKKEKRKVTEEEAEKLRLLKKRVKELKESMLFQIRKDFPDQSLGWFDTCLQVGQDGFSVAPAMGSGGVDGRMEFSANFFSNILLVLDDPESSNWANTALFESGLARLYPSSIGQFSPGNIGGPNATQGFEGGSTINPWDYILLIEGAPLLAGAMTRRCDTNQFAKAAFPFTVLPVAQEGDSVKSKDSNTARGELWLPLWQRFLKLAELEKLFGEGRAEWSGTQSRTNVDFAKAIANFGVDRGIAAFSRHGFLQRNGLAFLATPLGRFEVKAQPDVDLLRESDLWIDRFRRGCGDKTPARFGTALRRIDSAFFDYCRFGEKERFQSILIALGRAEREAANGATFRENAYLQPLQKLSPDWVTAADDGSEEFEIAAALAGIQGAEKYPGIRANLEPVEWAKGRFSWKDGSALVTWKRGTLAENLCAVLERRLLDWKRLSLPHLPIVSTRVASPATIGRFISGEFDDEKIEALLWGLIACRIPWKPIPRSLQEVPRPYALLKLCFPGIHSERQHADSVDPGFLQKGKAVKPEVHMLTLCRSGRLEEVLAIATRRLRSSLLAPAPIEWELKQTGIDPQRLAAALLIPVEPASLQNLWNLVRRKQRDEVEADYHTHHTTISHA